MDEIRALIVDDEPLARRGIRQLLAPYPDVQVVGECRDGREAVRALATLEPDLVFLDIQMPGLDGLGVIRTFGPLRMPLTVFVTAHDEFAVHAFEAQALDYLVKPISEARFRATMARVRERVRLHDVVALAARMSALLGTDAAAPARAAAGGVDRPIAVPTMTGERLLDSGDIEWIGADGDHATLHAGGATYRVRLSLAALERRLDPARFARIHRSAIVRVDRVREWKMAAAGGAVVVLEDATELPVSRRRLAHVKGLLRLA